MALIPSSSPSWPRGSAPPSPVFAGRFERIMLEPSRRERRRLEIRQRIVETALSLFETVGYEATTVTTIAERADIAYGTFFNHFPTKLDVLREVAELALSDLFRDVEELLAKRGIIVTHETVRQWCRKFRT